LAGEETSEYIHLRFITDEGHQLCFIDSMKIGKWHVGKWGSDRGPCPVQQFEEFHKNIINNIDKKIFDGPICEVLLNQKYFNGIGNYLRAEILYRAKIPPFMTARDALKRKSSTNKDDSLLDLCMKLPLELIILDANYENGDEGKTDNWKKCYDKPTSKFLFDKFRRKIWFVGESGIPGESNIKRKTKTSDSSQEGNSQGAHSDDDKENEYKPIKKKMGK